MKAEEASPLTFSHPMPVSWRAVELAEIGKIVTGTTPRTDVAQYYGEAHPFIAPGDITDAQYVLMTEKRLSEGGLAVSRSLPRETVLVVCIGATIGKTALTIAERSATNQQINAILVNDQALPAFVYYALRYRSSDLPRLAGRAAVPIVNKSTFAKFMIPLPPLLEQRAIARALRAVQQAKEARRREAALERERKAALMEHLFTHGTRGEATKQTEIGEMPKSWAVCHLGSIAEVAYGLTVNASRRKSTDLAPYLAVANVTRGAIKLENVKEIGMMQGDAERYRLQKGDVLLIEGNGNPKLLGSAAIWNAELPFALHQNHLIRARPDQSRVVPEWVMCYLNSDDGRSQLFGKAKTSSGLHSINSRLIAGLQIPLPPLDEQKDATDLLRACDAKITVLEREGALLDELFRALLEELMTGRLSAVPLIETAEGGGP